MYEHFVSGVVVLFVQIVDVFKGHKESWEVKVKRDKGGWEGKDP